MRSSAITLVGTAAALALALTACGGDKDDQEDNGDARAAPVTAGTNTPAGAQPRPTPVDPAQFPVSKPGTRLELGRPAVIPFDGGKEPSNLQVTITAVEKGSIEDLTSAGIAVKDEDKASTPYYVRATFKNVGTGDLSYSHPTTKFGALDAADRSLGFTVLFGGFKKCDAPKTDQFANGAEVTGCKVYLVPAGATVASVTYDFPDLSADPVVWKP
ncbi:MAG: hypothetical protein HOV68_00325 [Streptomycetaceae bacterium]|nr:hypothetical protein [Streptomycetaceae bacterium]